MIDTLVIPLLKIVIVLNATLVAVTYMVLLERKVIAWAQSRLGPMRVGPYGILQPVADAVKLMIKEDITPVRADRWVFTAAPIISMVPALIVYAVIPFGPEISLFGKKVTLYITDINVGLLYIVSVASAGVYGIILAEYANMIVVSSVVTTLFLGGWLPPFPNTPALHFLYYVPSWIWFFLKSFAFLYFFIWVRATLPRYRYDQLMRLGWKVLIPLAIANLVVTGIVKVLMA